MESDVFIKQMEVLEHLIGNRNKTQKDICDEVGISRRTFFRYIENYRSAGFDVLSSNNVFSISVFSPFVEKMNNAIFFSDEEMMFVASCISENPNSSVAYSLKNKLRRAYGVDLERASSNAQVETNKVQKILNAIEHKKIVVFERYTSPHSQTESDRIVEPYQMIQTRGEVRCYEVSSGLCKTFKIARILKVCVLDESWKHRSEHKYYYNDIFGFSGEEEIKIKLRVGYLARRILIEEYGMRKDYFIKDNDSQWVCYCRVCSFQGIGRFVLGLGNDIDVLENDEFKTYLRDKITKMSEKY